MTLRILHVFDHSLPLHSGYTFRSANILREQRKLRKPHEARVECVTRST